MTIGIETAHRAGVWLACAAAIIAVLSVCEVAGEEQTAPFVEAYASFEIQNDWTYDSDDPDNELIDLFATVEPTVVVNLIKGLTLTAHGVLEPVKDPDPGKDRYFDHEGFFLEDLFGQYATDTFSVLGGKFTQNFGRAWDIAPGIYGTDFAEDYEISERIGVGVSYTLSHDRFGSHTLSASVFFLDTSVLSESLITDRGRTRLSDGGPSNTESLESFVVAFDGGEFPETLFDDVLPGQSPVKGLTYQLAVLSQAAGEGSGSRETAILASIAHDLPVTNEVAFQPLLEYAYFFDADGTDGQDRYYLTASATAIWRKRWNLALSYTRRETMPNGAPDVGDNLLQVSAGYVFDFGIGVDVGWRFAEEDNVDSHTVGALLTYCLKCPED